MPSSNTPLVAIEQNNNTMEKMSSWHHCTLSTLNSDSDFKSAARFHATRTVLGADDNCGSVNGEVEVLAEVDSRFKRLQL